MVDSTCWRHFSLAKRGLSMIACCVTLSSIALSITIAMIVSLQKSCDKTENLGKTALKLSGISPIPCQTDACIYAASEILGNMDKSVHPCDNFYKFACGNFLKKTSIPDDKVNVDAFTLIQDQLQIQLQSSIEDAIQQVDHKPIKLVKNLYKSCMDKRTIQMQGVQPLLTMMKELGGWPVLEGDNWDGQDFHWTKLIYKFHDMGLPSDTFIGMRIDVDLNDTRKRAIHIDQSSLVLVDDFLVKEQRHNILTSYRNYMIDIAVLLGAPRPVAIKELTASFLFEVKLAEISLSPEKRRIITKLYNPMTIRKISIQYPSIPWKKYLNRLLAPMVTVDDDEMIIVNVPGYISSFEKIIANTPPRTQANYAMWRAVGATIRYLSDDIRSKQFQFEMQITGRHERRSRSEQCVRVVSHELPLSVASLYIKRNFHEDAKEKSIKMVKTIQSAFKKVLQKVSWMGNRTRTNGQRKAAAMTFHVGYPDEILNDRILDEYYEDLELVDDSYLKSGLSLSRFRTKNLIDGLRKPYNKSDWRNHGDAATVNAFYSPSENSIRVPAAILQGRFFDKERPQYMNFAGIGFIIGHEITHGFDDNGRFFDKNGNIVDWWTPSAEQKFLNQVECMDKQYGNFIVPEIGMSVDGIKTQNENIADNGGIKLAYLAYKKWASRNKKERSPFGLRYTPQQLFWISTANAWCAKYRPEHLKLMILQDPHSPSEFRINGPFSNMDGFAKDFNCPKGAAMNPINKCVIW